ncbi:hypothetical protein BGM09_13125 [Streptomyces sp. CBMA29]|nr:hypothetical protein [Streptomyces sp. CBMA29]
MVVDGSLCMQGVLYVLHNRIATWSATPAAPGGGGSGPWLRMRRRGRMAEGGRRRSPAASDAGGCVSDLGEHPGAELEADAEAREAAGELGVRALGECLHRGMHEIIGRGGPQAPQAPQGHDGEHLLARQVRPPRGRRLPPML